MKLYGRLLTTAVDDVNVDADMEAKATAEEVSSLVADRLPSFVASSELEVQERASCALQLIKHVQKQLAKGQAAGLGAEIVSLFDGELNPVAPKAQKKVQVPEGYVANYYSHFCLLFFIKFSCNSRDIAYF